MNNFDIKGFITAARQQGRSDSEIRAFLEQRGHVQPQTTQPQPTQTGFAATTPQFQTGLESIPKATDIFGRETEKTGTLRTLGRGVMEGVTGFGQSIAGAIGAKGVEKSLGESQQKLEEQQQAIIGRMQEARRKGEDTTQLRKALELNMDTMQNLPSSTEVMPSIETTPRQVVGQAAETALWATGGGLLGRGIKTVAGKTITPYTVAVGSRQATLGLKSQGLVTGGLFGGSRELQQEEISAGRMAFSTMTGAILGLGGAATAQAIGKVVQKMGSVRRARFERTQELAEMLMDPTQPISQRMAARTGGQPLSEVIMKAGKDPLIKEAVTQGVEAPHALLARHADDITKATMRKMLDIGKKGFQNPAMRARPTDIVGDSFMSRVSHVLNKQRQAGKAIEEAATALKSKNSDFSPAINSLLEDISGAGIRVTKDGKLNFAASDFAGMPSAQKAIVNIWSKARALGNNSYKGHQLKRYIDTVVDYGKSKGGLTGNAESLLKTFRSQVDGVLDNQFTAYNTANTTYSQTRNLTDQVQKLLGKSTILTDSSAVPKAGLVMRRIHSNSASRSDILKIVDELESYARATGYKQGDDLVGLVAFSDLMEDTFKLQAPASLKGQFERGLQQKVAGELVGSSFNLQGIRTALMWAYERTKGINHANKIKAIEALLEGKTLQQAGGAGARTSALKGGGEPSFKSGATPTRGSVKKNLTQAGEKLDSLNPTGSVFAKYTPQQRATIPLADNITTLNKTMGKPADEIITIYRGSSKGGDIVPGDFITTNKQLARDYAGTGKVVEKKVKLSDVLDDLTEPLGEEYIYRPKK